MSSRRPQSSSPSSSGTVFVGIIDEQGSNWERRTPLVPQHMQELQNTHRNIRFIVQPSSKRIFSDAEYEAAGAEISNNLARCTVILGIKNISSDMITNDKTYMCFSHTSKGKTEHMPLIDAIKQRKSRLIEFERIADDQNVRLLAFGKYAGIAATIDILSGLGSYLLSNSLATAFINLAPSFQQFTVDKAFEQLKQVGDQLRVQLIPRELRPLVFAITGEGRCSEGVWSALEMLNYKEVQVDNLPGLCDDIDNPEHARTIYVCQISSHHMVQASSSRQGSFNEAIYFANPQDFRPIFNERVLPYISVLFNCMYWDFRFPRLISNDDIQQLAQSGKSRLLAIADVSCDSEGSIEFLDKPTTFEQPFFVFDPVKLTRNQNIVYNTGHILYLANESLPSLLPADSSFAFSNGVKDILPNVVNARTDRSLEESGLSQFMLRAVIMWNGQLTRQFAYIDNIRKENKTQEEQQRRQRIEEIARRVHVFASLKIEGNIFEINIIGMIMDICNTNGIKFNVANVSPGLTSAEPSIMVVQMFGNSHEIMTRTLEEIDQITSIRSSIKVHKSSSSQIIF